MCKKICKSSPRERLAVFCKGPMVSTLGFVTLWALLQLLTSAVEAQKQP